MGESRNSYLLRTYEMTEAEYNDRELEQNYLCAVCRQPNRKGRDGETEPLSVDHSHYSGKNRGLTCQRCNTVLGLVDDSQEILFLLLTYLRTHDGSQIPGITGAEIRTALHRIQVAQPLSDPLPESNTQSEQGA